MVKLKCSECESAIKTDVCIYEECPKYAKFENEKGKIPDPIRNHNNIITHPIDGNG